MKGITLEVAVCVSAAIMPPFAECVDRYRRKAMASPRARLGRVSPAHAYASTIKESHGHEDARRRDGGGHARAGRAIELRDRGPAQRGGERAACGAPAPAAPAGARRGEPGHGRAG